MQLESEDHCVKHQEMDGYFRFRFCGRLMVSFLWQDISFISFASGKGNHDGRRDPLKGKEGIGRDDFAGLPPTGAQVRAGSVRGGLPKCFFLQQICISIKSGSC